MRVLLYADYRSPHARGWRDGLLAANIEVCAVSSEAVQDPNVVNPSGRLSEARQSYVADGKRSAGKLHGVVRRASEVQVLHSVIQIARTRSRKRDLLDAAEQFQPDLIHALRLPYEGLTALSLDYPSPVVVSSWGQDFVPQASSDPLLRHWIRKYLNRASAFQFDSTADLFRARAFGLSSEIPTLHAAGNFGVNPELFNMNSRKSEGLVVYGRKVTPNCNYWGFVDAATRLTKSTNARFVGVGLKSLEPEARRRYPDFDPSRILLIDELPGAEFAALIRSAQVVVSPSYSDGMPNTVLEAASSGANVVAGDLPQLRELKANGVSIDLVDASNPLEISESIRRQLAAPAPGALSLPDIYSREVNLGRVMDFYTATLLRERL